MRHTNTIIPSLPDCNKSNDRNEFSQSLASLELGNLNLPVCPGIHGIQNHVLFWLKEVSCLFAVASNKCYHNPTWNVDFNIQACKDIIDLFCFVLSLSSKANSKEISNVITRRKNNGNLLHYFFIYFRDTQTHLSSRLCFCLRSHCLEKVIESHPTSCIAEPDLWPRCGWQLSESNFWRQFNWLWDLLSLQCLTFSSGIYSVCLSHTTAALQKKYISNLK